MAKIRGQEALYHNFSPRETQRTTLFAERLTLEVEASKLGWYTVKPPRIVGNSGIEHSFSFVATSGHVKYAFDVYDQVTELEVLKTYARKFDTGSIVNLVSAKGTATSEAQNLAKEYGMKILRPEEVSPFFRSALIQNSPDQAEAKRALLSA
jgi:hypothetical protein